MGLHLQSEKTKIAAGNVEWKKTMIDDGCVKMVEGPSLNLEMEVQL